MLDVIHLGEVKIWVWCTVFLSCLFLWLGYYARDSLQSRTVIWQSNCNQKQLYDCQPTELILGLSGAHEQFEQFSVLLHWLPFKYNNNNNNRIQKHSSRFFTITSLCCEPSPTCTFKWPAQSCANHVQHIKCLLRATCVSATWYEGAAQLLSLRELKSYLFKFYFIGWTINQWRRGGNRSTQRKPLATSFRKCHILKPEDSSP